MVTFEKAVIKKYWPADDKNDAGEIVRQAVLQAEMEIDNSLQLAELFNSMVRGLVRVSLLDNVTGEEFVLPAVTLKPFNVKQKKIKIGKGEDADLVKAEYAALTLVTKMDEADGGQLLADLYRFFNIELQMSFEKFVISDEDEDEDQGEASFS